MPNEEFEEIEELEEEPEEVEEEPEEELDLEEPLEDDGDDIFQVSYKTQDGKDVTEQYTNEELANIVYQAKRGTPEIDDFVKEVSPILNAFQGSALIQQVAAYRSAGYSDEQIMANFAQIVSQSQQGAKGAAGEPKEYTSVEEEIEAKLNQRIQEIVGPLAQRLQAQEMDILKNRVAVNNSKLVERALEKRGLRQKDLTQEDQKMFVESFYALWPQSNWNFTELTPKQVNILVNDALRGRKSQKKGASAPGTVPAAGTINVSRYRGKKKASKPNENTTIESRAQAFKKFLG